MAQDAVQDALERLVRYADFKRFGTSEDLIRYFSVMVRNTVMDLLRSRSRHALPAVSDTVDPGDATDDAERAFGSVGSEFSNPEHMVATQRLLSDVEHSLEYRERLVFSLLMQEYTPQEIAARLGLTDTGARVVIHRLRTKIRALFR